MSVIIEAGNATYQDTGTVTSKGGNAAQNINRYPPKLVHWIDNTNVIKFSTLKQKQDFLARVSLLRKKPIDELTYKDFQNYTDGDQFFYTHGMTVNEFKPNTEELSQTDNFNNVEYFGTALPKFTPGSSVYLKSLFNTDSTGLVRSLGISGWMGAARTLYRDNYGNSYPGVIKNQDFDQGTLALMKKLFGQLSGFDEGHLNILKMMGLVDGLATDAVSTWKLNANGNALLESINNPQDTDITFIPSMALLALEPSEQSLAQGVKTYFSDTGYKENFKAKDVEDAAAAILAKMKFDKTALPTNLQIDDDTRKALNYLFGLSDGNTQFTTAQLNTAIAIGLVKYENTSSGKTVTLTDTGKIYLNDKKSAATDDGSSTTPTDTDPLAGLNGQEKLSRGLQHIISGGYFDIFDVGSTNNKSDDDFLISQEDIFNMADRSDEDDIWDEGAFSRITSYGERIKIIKIAQLIKNLIVQNPEAWTALAGSDKTFSKQELISFLGTHNANGQSIDLGL